MSATATVLTVERGTVDPLSFRGKPPTLAGLSELPENSVVRDPEGQPLVAYLRLWSPGDPTLEALRAELLRLVFEDRVRVSGLTVRALSFGYLPRVPMRTDFCRPAVVMREHPALGETLTALAAELETRYQAVAPEIFATHITKAQKVSASWRLPGAQCFTGGTINKDNAIGYHQDRGNFPATFSAMPIVRHGMIGGELIVPELGYYLPAADGTVTFFDGQELWHAVTPMTKARRDAHRFSIVYYSLTQLWNCLPPAAEVVRIQEKRTEREVRRARAGKVAT